MTAVRFRRVEAPETLRRYTIELDGEVIGWAERRRGGWWRGVAADGAIATSWARTRDDAARCVTTWREIVAEG